MSFLEIFPSKTLLNSTWVDCPQPPSLPSHWRVMGRTCSSWVGGPGTVFETNVFAGPNVKWSTNSATPLTLDTQPFLGYKARGMGNGLRTTHPSGTNCSSLGGSSPGDGEETDGIWTIDLSPIRNE